MTDDSFLGAMVRKLEEAREAEGQFKDVKINEVIVHMKIEASDQNYADKYRELIEE